MCRTCGCSNDVATHGHDHGDDPGRIVGGVHHAESPLTNAGVVVTLEQRVLERNDLIAFETRSRLRARGVFAINLMSAPGAGKTTLLERLLHEMGGTLRISVIEGDQATDHDAERVRAAGGRAVQVNTGSGCHLDATMVARALEQLQPAPRSLVVIENVGNLVCPAMFDLGESQRVVVTSVTDGDDKPLKYPHMFRAADVLLLNKIDLLPYVRFDRVRYRAAVDATNRDVLRFEISATHGDGLDAWYAWLRGAVER